RTVVPPAPKIWCKLLLLFVMAWPQNGGYTLSRSPYLLGCNWAPSTSCVVHQKHSSRPNIVPQLAKCSFRWEDIFFSPIRSQRTFSGDLAQLWESILSQSRS